MADVIIANPENASFTQIEEYWKYYRAYDEICLNYAREYLRRAGLERGGNIV